MGPVFEGIRSDPRLFAQVRAEGGTVVWPNGADLCPDFLIWGGAPPEEGQERFFRPGALKFLSFESIFPLPDFAARARTRLWKA